MGANASRGDVWQVDLDPVRGHEQGRRRPAVIVSTDRINHGPSDMVVVVPVTSRARPVPTFVRIHPSEAGLSVVSYAICDQPRAISKERLVRRYGMVGQRTLSDIEDRLRLVLNL